MKLKHLGQYALGIALGFAVFFLTACSFKVEFGYHGETGRSDTTDTRYIKGGK